MFKNIRQDYIIHGHSLINRAFWAMIVYRFGKWSLNVKIFPFSWIISKIYGFLRLISEIITNITIDPKMIVGEGFHLIHAEGPISIHPNVVIGKRCGVMHNVTIGTNMSDSGVPKIGDDVFIGVGACILGNIKIGNRVRISANSLVITDIPDDSIVIGVPAKALPRLQSLSK